MGEEPNLKSQWVKAEKYIQLGIMLPAATLVGWVAGAALDRWLHARWLSFAGLVLGILAGLTQFIRTVLSEDFKD